MEIKRIKPKRYVSPMPIPPGNTIKQLSDELGMNQKELSVRLGVSAKHITDIIKGRAPITIETAEKLEVIFDVDASFWINLESRYREAMFKLNPTIITEQEKTIARSIPYTKLVQEGWIAAATKKVEEKVVNLRKFFGINNLCNIPEINVAYKKANICKENNYALTSWIRIAEIQAQQIETEKINKKKLMELIPIFRELTKKSASDFFPELRELCASVGIALVVANHLPGTGVHGVTFLNSKKNKIIIQLSVRRKMADTFWFTFFHEISHILSDHDNEFTYIDSSKEIEDQMDTMARNFLIPDEMYKSFIQNEDYTNIHDIQAFCEKQNIHPCILVGRLKFDQLLPYTIMTDIAPKFEIN